jgi:putative SOS response-associated peptidase YedK
MPVIVAAGDQARWLDADEQDDADLVRAYPSSEMVA